MNIGKVYTPPIIIAKGIDRSTRGIGAHDEYWKGVHPSDIHGEGYRPLDRGIGARGEYWKGVHPSNIHRKAYTPLDGRYRGMR